MAEPRFSVLTPTYDTPADVLWAMLESVRGQTFGDWELCLVDDCSPQPRVIEMLERVAAEDPRIRVHRRDSNGGIVAASNDALAMAGGELVALLDHDDELHPDALAHVHEALLAEPEADYVYTDEDKIDRDGHHSGPFFKPDWSPERMRTQMYSCHLSVFRRSLVEEVGGFDADFEGSQDWDLVLKATERARAVLHVPRVLYHWRMLESSAAGGGEAAKPWAFEAGKRAIEAHCERIGLPAAVERDSADAGVYHLRPRLREEPLVSIVIPSAGGTREVRYERTVLVGHCVRSIVERSSYGNYEIVCVLDTAAGPEVVRELEEAAGERLRLVPYDRPFNFSEKVNAGAARSEGEHLLLLNDDIEVATPDWIERMVMYSSLEEIGAVGGRLVLQDGRLQHVGVRFEQGLPGHPYHGYRGDYKGYGNAVRVAQNCLAVTGACLMTRRKLFEQVGGLGTELPVNYNDVDYCLKLHERGKRVVYDPDLAMVHFESSSRSMDVEDWEKELLKQRWLPLTAVDPYSNPNLRHEMPRLTSPFAWALRRRPRLRRRRPKGQPVRK
ncbi:MAG TPA: glycosyltransferase [Solirubrobacterales bacterium]|nr:glycosyltransferase [Solirubrobacterales bacterium]